MCDKGARQFSVLDIVLDLQAHVVTGHVLLKLSRLGRIELHLLRKRGNNTRLKVKL